MVGGAAAAQSLTTTHYFRYHESDKTMTVTTVQCSEHLAQHPHPEDGNPELVPAVKCDHL